MVILYRALSNLGLAILSLLFLSMITLGQSSAQNFTVVIDAGHGGSDPGKPRISARYKHEKDVNLAIALRVGTYIEEYLPTVKVVYTRQDDRFLSLEDRANIANDLKADVFLSIHANASHHKSVSGTESHIYSYQQRASFKLAKLIEDEFREKAKRRSRGVIDATRRGKNLYLTQYTQMPSVLVETGYMTNQSEAAYLNSDYGQSIIASAIYRALRTYLQLSPQPENRKAYYRVQIMASTKPVDFSRAGFDDLNEKVVEYESSGSNKYRYKYLIGREYDLKRAKKLREKIAKLGFKDAFVVAFDE